MQVTDPVDGKKDDEERPPIFRSWQQVYAAIVCYLFLVVGLLLAFSQAFTI